MLRRSLVGRSKRLRTLVIDRGTSLGRTRLLPASRCNILHSVVVRQLSGYLSVSLADTLSCRLILVALFLLIIRPLQALTGNGPCSTIEPRRHLNGSTGASSTGVRSAGGVNPRPVSAITTCPWPYSRRNHSNRLRNSPPVSMSISALVKNASGTTSTSPSSRSGNSI